MEYFPISKCPLCSSDFTKHPEMNVLECIECKLGCEIDGSWIGRSVGKYYCEWAPNFFRVITDGQIVLSINSPVKFGIDALAVEKMILLQ